MLVYQRVVTPSLGMFICDRKWIRNIPEMWMCFVHRLNPKISEVAKHICIPSGYVKIAIENGHRNSGFSQL